ncbi:MAM and LDL-receptor class A domain-containing protein 1-like [Haliotis rubra]|uniref:MAM and LDL-receptor class A domain-containing protein 1-like n=1 Tax=Haliotis rubra TaxID=36100 RepID=UPI001EE5BB0F|nr:MAM and LDL-receptor class A domain-containing protein 1-like [Haliotis rubra]
MTGAAQCLISCDFEDGLCGWSDLSNSSYDWTRHSGPTADFTSGPGNDHTFKDVAGHYVYTNGDRAARSSVAQLRSNTVTLTSSVNLTFWYHMNGNGIGNVSLIREDNDTDDGIVLWSRHGRQGLNWLESHVTLDPGTFQLQFESTVSHPYGSDIALDDIRLWSEPHVTRTRPPPTSTIETTLTSAQGTSTTTAWNCNVQSPAGVLMSGSCDFETNGTCGYTSSGGPLQWGLTQGRKGYLHVIPGDHGTGTGHYMYLATENISSRSGDMAKLTSPALELNTSACLQFAYIITSGDPITLTVYAETSGQQRLVASITTHGMTSWRVRENVTLCADTSTKIVFESTKKSYASFIGLDDINVISGDCNGSYSHTTSHQSTLVTSTPSSDSTSSSPTSTAHTNFTPTEGGQTVVPTSSSVSSSTASTKGQTSVSLTTPSSSPLRQSSSTKLTGHSFPYTEETSPETTHASAQQSERSSSPASYSVSVEVAGSVSDSSSLANPSTEGNSATTEETVISDTHTTSCQDNSTTIPEAKSTITVLSAASETSNNNKGSSAQTSPSVTSRTRLPRTTTPFLKKHGQSSQGGLSYDNKVVVIVVACGALVIAAVSITVWRLRARRKLHLSDIPSTLDSNIELQAKVYIHNTHM